MESAPKLCFDKILPQNQLQPQRIVRTPNGGFRAINPIGKKWVNGSDIRICFLDGTDDQKGLVQKFAPEWTEHANLNFHFTDDPRAEIRITFDLNDGAWSYVGTDNKGIPLHAATLNLGWQDQGVILHEFGHMIGLAHEHSSPKGGIVWNREAVIQDLSGPPNHWDLETIEHNVFKKYAIDQIQGTDFDPDSIMLYAFPDEWTENIGATHENEDLSKRDKDFIRSKEMYPGRGKPETKAQELTVATATEAAISAAGEEDLYQFDVGQAGIHVIETSGSTDVVLSLFGPNNATNLIAQNDDGGAGNNSRISADLEPGHYFARVQHYDRTGSGEYKILIAAH